MEWRDVLEYEGLYKVSENGDVISLRNNHILKPFAVRDHYAVNICKDKKRRMYYLHRLVYEAFNGKIPEGCIVCHITSDLSDNSINNIKLYTSIRERYLDENAESVKSSHTSSGVKREKAIDLDGEVWVDMIDSNGRYEVSNFGRIKNKNGYIIRPYLKRKTYFCACLNISKEKRINVFVHRLIYESFNGKISIGNVVDHIDSDPLNNRLDNLRETTIAENLKNKNSHKKSNDGRDSAWKKNGGKSGISIFKINENGKILEKYRSISEASNDTNICVNYLRRNIAENGMLKENNFLLVKEDDYENLLAELPLS